MKNLYGKAMIMGSVILLTAACGGSKENKEESASTSEPAASEAAAPAETDPMKNKGIGPVTSVEVGPLDAALAEKGKGIFESKCGACHKFDQKYVGPALGGVTKRRTPEWIMNQILNPVEMAQKDPIGQELLATYLTQMTFQNVTQEDTRAILEYFRQVDSK